MNSLILEHKEADRQTMKRLLFSKVLTYANTLQRQHRAWADANAPTTLEIHTVLEELRRHPNCFGQQYKAILQQTLLRRQTTMEVLLTQSIMQTLDVRVYIGGDCV